MTTAETTHKREGLKPCPFCGANDTVLVVEQIPGCPECDDNCYIRCNQCFAGGPNREDERRAETDWNERQWIENQELDWQWQEIKKLVKANDRLGAENAYLRLCLTPLQADAARPGEAEQLAFDAAQLKHDGYMESG